MTHFNSAARSRSDIIREPTNLLIGALDDNDRDLLVPYLERVDLKRGETLFAPGDAVSFVHFPCDASMVSLVVTTHSGRSAETASVGREGAVGGVVSHGLLPAFTQGCVQSSGPALRIRVARLQEAKMKSVSLRNLITRYSDCLLAQVLQSVACNALHTLEARCARWLLSCRDRIGGDVLPITQESLAQMLGASRPYVSRALGVMQAEGLVEPGRGRIRILDADSLEQTSCECYGDVRRHFQTVLAGVYPTSNLCDMAS